MIDLEEFYILIKNKKTIDLSEYSSLKKILYENLFNLIPVITNKIPKGEILFRTVPVNRGDVSVGRKSYISYRPKNINYPYFNRCSEPEQSHFYCSTDRHLSIAECSYFISEAVSYNSNFTKNKELLEVGAWEVQSDIYVADLRFGNFSHPDGISFQSNLKQKYRQFNNNKLVNDFFDYINRLFEEPIKKNNHLEYWLTACYSNYLLEESFIPQQNWGKIKDLKANTQYKLFGLLYHSVKGLQTTPPLKGFNLVLKTDLIDKNNLRLRKAGIFETRQIDNRTFNLDRLIKINADIKGDSWYYEEKN